MIKRIMMSLAIASVALMALANGDSKDKAASGKYVVAYVTSWRQVIPNPDYMTHINYAFGHVNDTFDGVRVDNPERLRRIAALKSQAPHLKVLLSIGGWGSGRFSEMAADARLRKAFARDCRRVMAEFNLDGIDIDWEYPTSAAANISSSPDDTKNFTLLMRDLRKTLGRHKLLTLASVSWADYIDFASIVDYIDFVNIMAYDMGHAPLFHSALYTSKHSEHMNSSRAVEAHRKAGVPSSKLVLGMPFFGRGNGKTTPNFQNYRDIKTGGAREKWDDEAKMPYLVDSAGTVVMGYDNPRSLAYKCRYIKEQNLLGGMYWEYSGDKDTDELRRTVSEALMKGNDQIPMDYPADYAREKRFKVLLYYTKHAEPAHVAFAEQTVDFFKRLNYGEGFALDVSTTFNYTYDDLKTYDAIVMPDGYPMDQAGRAAFEEYMEKGGRWMGFHASAYNDKNTGWPWFVKFLGGGVFYCNNWPPQPALLEVERPTHAVTKNLPKEFVAPASEWYMWNPSPRDNSDVEVLLSLSAKNYPIGIKDIIHFGDFPVVWTNKRYRMIYLNMGHGDEEYTDATQKLLFVNAFRWLLRDKLPLR